MRDGGRDHRMPAFLLIGAAKSGTSAVAEYLREHPQIFIPAVKEPNFFALEGGGLALRGPRADLIQRFDTLERYTALFAGAGEEQAIGEASTYYLYVPGACERIARYAPGVRLIAILRHPVERAFSQFLMNRMLDREPLGTFEDALAAEDGRVAAGWAPDWHYARMGFYHRQLAPYVERFGPEQVEVAFYEELTRDPLGLMARLYRFIGVDPGYVPDTSRKHNVTRVPRSPLLERFLSRPGALRRAVRSALPKAPRAFLVRALRRLNTGAMPALVAETRARLVELFREDVLRLEELVGRDLTAWRDAD